MTNTRNRSGDWDREEWAGEGRSQPGDVRPEDAAEAGDEIAEHDPGAKHWVKTEWVGNQGHGSPEPMDPETMQEGEGGLSGYRHNPGGTHWAGDDASGQPHVPGEEPVDRR